MDFEESRDVAAAPEVVWGVVSDRQRLAEWVPTTTSGGNDLFQGVRECLRRSG